MANKRVLYTEEMVGYGHPTKTDILNRHAMVEHEEDGTHGAITPTSIVNTGLTDLSGAAAGQIKFPAAQNASADANTLDDYEEGTWDPGVSFGGLVVGITYDTHAGYYTKIGDIIIATGYIRLTSKGSSVGSALITGLPIAAVDNDAAYSAASLRLGKITFANQHQGVVPRNTTTVALFETTEAGAETALADTDFANDSYIVVTAIYRAQ
jgi:hypothetical protein